MQEYYWWIKYWQFYQKIANYQNLLLTNISSFTVHVVVAKPLEKYQKQINQPCIKELALW